VLTKDSSFVLFTQEPKQNFLFPKGVVDGERALMCTRGNKNQKIEKFNSREGGQPA
jgi:hypothetical protein